MLHIRTLSRDDTQEITDLANQLGYEIDEATVSAQIASIVEHPDQMVFVAVQNNALVGFIHGCKMIRLTSPTFWEICGLVVSERHRRQGIGKKLVQHFENEVETNMHMRVRCNVKRRSAHMFYRDLSYAEKKEQKVFEKQR